MVDHRMTEKDKRSIYNDILCNHNIAPYRALKLLEYMKLLEAEIRGLKAKLAKYEQDKNARIEQEIERDF